MSNAKIGWQGVEWGNKVKSKEITLNSGSLYNLELKYYRRNSQNYYINSRSFLHVKWSSDKLKI